MPKKKGEKLPDPKETKACKTCGKIAVFLEDYCWEHLPEEVKVNYKSKIESWAIKGNSLARSNLSGADLQGIKLGSTDLQKAVLSGANLQGAFLLAANLQEASLVEADLRKADLLMAKLQKAFLNYANLAEADCTNANFSGTSLWETHFEGACLDGAIFENALYLQWNNIKKVGDENEKTVINFGWVRPRLTYLCLKNYFHLQGKYEDESKAYYREKLMSKHECFWHCFRGYSPERDIFHEKPPPYFKERFKAFFRWFGLWFFHVLTGFGERWWWTVLWALGVIGFFGFLYWGGGAAGWFKFAFKPEMIPSIFQYFYLSVVTFATLGFGDITPLCWQAQVPVVIEVIFGYLFLGLIITIIARRFGR